MAEDSTDEGAWTGVTVARRGASPIRHKAAVRFDVTDQGFLYIHTAEDRLAVYAPGDWAHAVRLSTKDGA